MADYKIRLGTDLDTSNLQSQISKLDNKYDVKLGVKVGTSDIRTQISKYNQNSNNAKLQIKVKLDTSDIKTQLKELNGLNVKNGKGITIPLNTASLESSLNEVSASIREIKASIGSLDSGAGLSSLLSSVNQISVAVERATGQFTELNAELRALSSKDFSVNIGLNMGGSNPVARSTAYGNKVRNETLPQLKQQVNDIVKFYNDTYKTSLNEFEVLQKMVSGTKLSSGDFFETFLFGKDSVATRMSGGSLSGQMQAFKQYIDMFKQAASLKGFDISSVTSGFSKSADDLIKDAQDIQTGANEMENGFEKLRQVMGGAGGLNTEAFSGQLDSIVADLSEIRKAIESLSSGASLDGLTQSFNNLSETLDKLMANAKEVQSVLGGNISGAGMANQAKEAQETANALKEVSGEAKKLSSIDASVDIKVEDGNIDELRAALRDLGVSDDFANNVIAKLNEIGFTAQKVSATFKNGELFKVDVNGVQAAVNGISQATQATVTFGQTGEVSAQRVSQSFDKVAAKADQIRAELKDTGYDGLSQSLQRAHAEADRFASSSNELQVTLNQLDAAMERIKTADEVGDIKALCAAYDDYKNTLKQVESQTKQLRSQETLQIKKDNALLKLKNAFGKGSEAAKKFAAEIEKLENKIRSCGNLNAFGNIEKELTGLISKVRATGVQTQTFGQQLKAQFSKYSAYFGVAEIFMYGEMALRDMFEQVKSIDTAMTELKKVTDETDASYNQFLTNAASRAKEIGTTIDGLVTSTADFARLGYDFVDAQGLAEVANIYAVVGDEIDGVEGATQSLVSTLTAFKGEMGDMSDSDFALSIVDKMNEVSNNFAISSGGIGDALQRSASSMSAANNTLDETIALITAANTVVQDPDAVGTAFKTISMRIKIHCPR